MNEKVANLIVCVIDLVHLTLYNPQQFKEKKLQ